ncbi:hypothetical protein BUE64_12170 [Corynebacterium diphtheriae subsp. lausannense]|nr:hypothetical protein BUE64_12170 [Corynebacterium diphtheriae subsp. lausannense]
MMPSHLNHNDITLGFPLALETNTNSIVEALHQLMTEDSIGGLSKKPYEVDVFSDSRLTDRLSMPPYVPDGLRGSFEVFTKNENPTYIIWRVNHSDIDALSVLSFWEQLHSTVMGIPRRWYTPHQLLKSNLSSYRHDDWIDTDGEPIELPLYDMAPTEASSRLAAAFAVAFVRKTGRSKISLGFINSGRESNSSVAPKNALTILLSHCEIDVAEALQAPQAAFSRIHEKILHTIRDSPKSCIATAESVDVLVNLQTLNWYKTSCSILGNSTPTFSHPVTYRQVTQHVFQVRADVEYWDPKAPRLRVRNSPYTTLTLNDVITDGLEILDGNGQSLPVCSGVNSHFEPLRKYLESFLKRLDSSTIECIDALCCKLNEIEDRFAIGLIKKPSAESFLQVISCILSRRVCHFLGEESSKATAIDRAVSQLGVPVAIPFIDKPRYALPDETKRSVASDAKTGWAYIVSSGSTENPKVTLLSFAMSENILGNAFKYLRINSNSRIAMLASPMFDAIYFECLLSLATAQLPYVPGSVITVINSHQSIGIDHGCTHLVATPTVLSLLITKDISLPNMIMSVGERLPDSLLRSLKARGKYVLDLYGPSEAGIWSGIRDATQSDEGFHPIDNVYFRPGSGGDSGRYDVHIGLSSAVFGSAAFEVAAGDSAVFHNSANSISSISRADGLVKISGRRITLSEINDILLQKTGVSPNTITEIQFDSDYSGQTFAAIAVVESPERESIEVANIFGARFVLYRVANPPTTLSGKLDITAILSHFGMETIAASSLKDAIDVNEQVTRIWQRYTGASIPTMAFSDTEGCSLDALRIQIDLGRQGIQIPLPSPTTTLQDLIYSAEKRKPRY